MLSQRCMESQNNGPAGSAQPLGSTGWIVLLLLLTLLPATTVSAESQDKEAGDLTAQALDIVNSVGQPDGLSAAQAAVRLADLGQGVLPVLTESLAEATSGARASGHADLYRDAIRRMPKAEVLTYLRSTMESQEGDGDQEGDPVSYAQRVIALRTLRILPGAEPVALTLEIASGIEPDKLRSRAFSQIIQQSLVAQLREGPRHCSILIRTWPDLAPRLREICIEAFSTSQSRESVRALVQLVARERATVIGSLTALGGLPAIRRDWLEVGDRKRIAGRLRSRSPEVRRAAALAVGGLRISGAFAHLAGMLADEDKDARVAAMWAIGELSGLSMSVEPREWMDWAKREFIWMEEEAPKMLAQLRFGSREEVLTLIEQLSRHRLVGEALAPPVAALVRESDIEVRLAALKCLTSLRATSALPELLYAVQDLDPQIQEAATTALVAVTGLRSPENAGDWQDLISR